MQFDSSQPALDRMESCDCANGTRQIIDGIGPFDNAWAAWRILGDEQLHAVVIRGIAGSISSILDAP